MKQQVTQCQSYLDESVMGLRTPWTSKSGRCSRMACCRVSAAWECRLYGAGHMASNTPHFWAMQRHVCLSFSAGLWL